jgi:hypothetical protein
MIRVNRTVPAGSVPLFTVPEIDSAAALVGGVEFDEPTAGDLAEIDEEWLLIAAEIAVVEAEIAMLCAPVDGASEMDWRRLRRARARVLREAAAHADYRRAAGSTVGRVA